MRLVAIGIASVVLFFPTFWLFSSAVGANWGAGIAAVAMYVAFPAIALRVWRAPAVPQPASMEGALDAGELCAVEYEVSEAVEAEEFEDEGKHFWLAIGPSETLFLSGQYLYKPVERGIFPSTRIRLFWHKSLGITYGVQCMGEPLKAKVLLPAFTEDQFRAGAIPTDREVSKTPIQQVINREA